MSNDKVIRAWKDPEYRAGLSHAEQAALPPSPVGAVELSEAEMAGILGGLDLSGGGGPAAGRWSQFWSCTTYNLYCKIIKEHG